LASAPEAATQGDVALPGGKPWLALTVTPLQSVTGTPVATGAAAGPAAVGVAPEISTRSVGAPGCRRNPGLAAADPGAAAVYIFHAGWALCASVT
jgi:hypothetical protein